MRIISQDGKMSIEFDGTTINVIHDTIAFGMKHSKGSLGVYESEQRAGEVFMEMHNQWQKDCMSVFEMPIQ